MRVNVEDEGKTSNFYGNTSVTLSSVVNKKYYLLVASITKFY